MAGTTVGENAREIARLRKKGKLTRILFISCIAFMPVSCLGGCGLALLIPHDATRAVLGMAGIFAPFVGLGGMLLMWGDRGRYGRSLDLALQADELGLTYTEQPTRRQLDVLRQFQVFHAPTNEYSRNYLEGEFENTEVVILDYSCSWGLGRYSHVIAQTVFVFPDAVQEAPDLSLFPKGVFDKLGEAIGLGGQPIPIPGATELNREYGLYSEVAKEAAALFTAEVAAAVLKERNLMLEVSRGTLLIFWSETYIKTGELQEKLATAIRLRKLLRRTH